MRPLTSLRGSPEDAIELPLSASHVMSGTGSQELAERLAAPTCTPLERFAALAEFFLPPGGRRLAGTCPGPSPPGPLRIEPLQLR